MSLAFTDRELKHLRSVQRLLLDPPLSDAALRTWVESVCEEVRRLLHTDHVYYLEPDGLVVPPDAASPRAGDAAGPGDRAPVPSLFVQAASGGEAFENGIRRHFRGFRDGFSQFREAYPTLQHRMIRAAGPCAVHDAPLHDMALREQLAIYQEVFRAPGIDRQMALSVPLPQGEAMLIAGYRNDRAADFQGKRHRMLELLVPAFEAGLGFRRRLHAVRDRLIDMVDRLDTALLLFDDDGQQVHANRAFRTLVSTDHLPPDAVQALRAAAQALACGIAPATGGEKGDGRPMAACQRSLTLAGVTYALQVRPSPAAEAPGTLVAVERTSLLPPPAALQARFGLTPRETDVARLLAEGRTDAEIAEVLFISVHTVRRHSGQVLKKLDVSSRAAVAITLLRG